MSPVDTGRARRLVRLLAGSLAVAWLLPVGLHLIGLDLLLVPIVLVAAAALPRTGSPLDRLVVAAAALYGTLCAAGLLYSVWPWGLHPVPIAGTALTVVAVVGALRYRRGIVVRAAPGARDWLVLGGGLGVGAVALVPFVARDLAGRLGVLMLGEDWARHFVFFDVIGRIDGYPFLAGDAETRPFYGDDLAQGMRNYPQGLHMAFAVVDRFVRSATASADGVTAMRSLIWLYVGAFAAVAVAVLWAVRRVAGPGISWVRLTPVLALASAWLAFGDPVAVFVRGFPNELVALGLVAILTALVSRPLPALNDQLVSLALLVVGVSFTYHLFLPYALAAVGVHVLRARLLGNPVTWIVAVPALALASVTPLLNLYAVSGAQLTAGGTALAADRPATVLLVVLAFAGLVVRGGLRSPSRRTAAALLGAATAVPLLLGAYQIALVGKPIYYFEKTLHMLIVVALVALGGLARLVPRAGLVRFAAVVPIVLVMAALGGPWHTDPGSGGLRLLTGLEKGSPGGGRDAVLLAGRHPTGAPPGDVVNVDLMDTPYRNWFGTLYASAMQGTYRHGHFWYLWQHPTGTPKTMADLERAVVDSPVRVRFFVANPAASMLVVDPAAPRRGSPDSAAFGDPGAPTNIAAVELLAAKYPGKVEIVRLPAPP